MKCVGIILLLLSLVPHCKGSSVTNATASADILCPLWTRRGDSGACECGDNLDGVVNCDPSTLEVTILVCHCMTYSNVFNTTVVGHCIFNCLFLDYLYVGVDTCHHRNMHRRGKCVDAVRKGMLPLFTLTVWPVWNVQSIITTG